MSSGSLPLGHYDRLEVSRSAAPAAIRSAYRRRALQTHPDKGGSAEHFLQVVSAFEVVVDSAKRKLYDAQLRRSGSSDGLKLTCNAESNFPNPSIPTVLSPPAYKAGTFTTSAYPQQYNTGAGSSSPSGVKKRPKSMVPSTHHEPAGGMNSAAPTEKVDASTKAEFKDDLYKPCNGPVNETLFRELFEFGDAASELWRQRLSQLTQADLQAFAVYVRARLDEAAPKRKKRAKVSTEPDDGGLPVVAADASTAKGSSDEEDDSNMGEGWHECESDFSLGALRQCNLPPLAILDMLEEHDKTEEWECRSESASSGSDAAEADDSWGASPHQEQRSGRSKTKTHGIHSAGDGSNRCYARISFRNLRLSASKVPLEQAILDHIHLVAVRTAVINASNAESESLFEDLVFSAFESVFEETPSFRDRVFFHLDVSGLESARVPFRRIQTVLELRRTLLRIRDETSPLLKRQCGQTKDLRILRQQFKATCTPFLQAHRTAERAARLEDRNTYRAAADKLKAERRAIQVQREQQRKLRAIALRKLMKIVAEVLKRHEHEQVKAQKKAQKNHAKKVQKQHDQQLKGLKAILNNEGLSELPRGVQYLPEGPQGCFYADLSAVSQDLELCQGPCRERARKAIADLGQLTLAFQKGGQASARCLAEDLDVQDATERFMNSLG